MLLSVAWGFSSTGKMGMLWLGSSGSVGLGCGFSTSANEYGATFYLCTSWAIRLLSAVVDLYEPFHIVLCDKV